MKRPVAVALAALGLSGSAVLSAPGALADAGGAAGAHDRSATQGLVAQVRQAVDPYREVDVALEHGYVPVSGCDASPAGGMGIHFLSFDVAASLEVDPARPTILLYGPDGRGGLRLLGAEWWQPVVGQPRPYLGGEPFDGPMPGHSEHMPTHYDLHVWTHVANPAGVFAPWNPNVSC